MLGKALCAFAGAINSFAIQRKGINGVLKLESRNPPLPPLLPVSKISVF
jgi:hypothetical protein